VGVNLAADGGDEKVGPAGIEALVDQEIDVAEIDDADVEGDFLSIWHTIGILGEYGKC
jgi:hypothetical protein